MEFLEYSFMLWEPHMRCLYALWQRPWFGRVWIRQEVLLNDSVVLFCGKRGILWPEFIAAHYYVNQQVPQILPSPNDMERGANIAREHRIVTNLSILRSYNLPAALRNASHCDCLDPRDKTYGSFGIFTASSRRTIINGITVDYTKSVLEVYRDSALYVVQQSKRSTVLDTALRLPYRAFSFAQEILHAVWTGPDTDRVRLSAVLGPKIQQGHTPQFNIHLHQERRIGLATSLQWASPKLMEVGDVGPFETIVDTFTNGENSRHVDMLQYKAVDYDAAKECVVALIESQGQTPILPEWQRFEGAASWSCKDHRIIVTENWLLGVAPRSSVDGDVVATLPGCDSPIVLRQQEDGAFTVIGECYVHGLSFEESLLGLLEDNLRLHWCYGVSRPKTGLGQVEDRGRERRDSVLNHGQRRQREQNVRKAP
ncbi:hypothetical protein BU23DRAFT_569332 [Bimuria novae-zelandiae CBS 107.79]|uniref:Heterokaryon incompatibility domain-containing protein n=1 Tax=Bimuria novae-zelandiae CBS 107.79 TaxID=1447943 RepID=A0A6A5V4Q5_9PLEO|nr:hypothetical protein BU23DRAFT_569332 [Bimuria novae-zelandiae CBS 107.79]